MNQQQRINSQVVPFLILLVSFLLHSTLAVGPYFTLPLTAESKCIAVEFPKTALLFVDYEVFDFNEKNEKIALTIKPKVEHADDDDYEDDDETRSEIKRHEITTSKGQTSFTLDRSKGSWGRTETTIEICIIRSASRHTGRQGNPHYNRKPHLISLKLKETPNMPKLPDFAGMKNFLNKTSEAATAENQKNAQEHFTYLERMVYNMASEAELLMGVADDVKVEEAKFFQKSIEINAAAKWWPIMHLCVLLVTGYTQATHIVRFFKSRHII